MTQSAKVDIQSTPTGGLCLTISGDLTANELSTVWRTCLHAIEQHPKATLTLDATQLTDCDGAGISLLQTLKAQQTERGEIFTLTGLAPRFQALFDFIEAKPAQADPRCTQRLDKLSQLGAYTSNIISYLHCNIEFMGECLVEFWAALKHPHYIRWQDAWRFCENVGPKALPIIMLVGFLLGLILGFQASIALDQFGANIYVANLVGVSLTRELGPLMTAVLLAGRTASAFAAEIGTMKVNQEIDALTTMGLKPLRFLILPRLLSVMCMAPLLNIFMILAGLMGCALVMKTLGYSLDLYLHQLETAITLSSLAGGLLKTLVFGIVIANIGCLHGLRTQQGASAVGDSTTQAVVSSIVMIALVDGLFAVIYYALGI